jgi:putative Holliday junction resolvase
MLGLDVGEARIGAAVGEVGHAFVFGRGVIDASNRDEAVRQVRELAEAEGAERVVVGLPRHTDGAESEQSGRVRAFADALIEAGLDVVFEDERFTTQLAAQQVRGSGLPPGKPQQKGRLDEASARLILESYLTRLERERAAQAPRTPDGDR